VTLLVIRLSFKMKIKIEIILSVLSVLSLTTAQLLSVNSILSGFSNSPNLFDGPRSVSSAPLPTAPNSKRPTLEQINYYSHYGVVNCPVSALDFNCTDCREIKDDIYSFKTITNFIGLRALLTVSHKRQEIVASFRGTTTPMDYILDFAIINATPDPNSKIKVHTGFYIAAMSLYQQVTEAIGCQLSQNPTYKIVLTGCSLGGAIARVFQFYYKFNDQFSGVPVEVYTYGEPRSGNKYYADNLNSHPITTVRVVNKADMIPHLPPTSVLNSNFLYDNYVHVLHEFWIKSTNTTTFCGETAYEDENCSNSLGPGYTVLDHTQYPGTSSSQCINDVINLLSPLKIISILRSLPALPTYLKISPTVECGFVTDLTLIDL